MSIFSEKHIYFIPYTLYVNHILILNKMKNHLSKFN